MAGPIPALVRKGGLYLLAVALAASACNAQQTATPMQKSAAQTGSSSNKPNDFSTLRKTLNGAITSGKLEGVSLLLMQNGKILFREAYGNLSVEDRVRIASSTKPIATVGILQLVDAGKLQLDDTVGSLLPEFKGTPVATATLRQLLSHQAGIKGTYPGGRPKKGSMADFSKLIASRGTLQSPGQFSYSGVSMDIACRMAEVAAGIPIEEHLKTGVLQPLDMTHSGFSLAAAPGSVSSAQLARGEGRYVSCGGGLDSTLDDMANFYEMLLQGGVYKDRRLLSPELYAQMVSKQGQNQRKLNDPYTTGEYGLGIYRDRVASDGQAITISHGGALGTMPWVDIDTGLIGIFFSESNLRKVKPLVAEVQTEVRGKEYRVVAAPTQAASRQTTQNPADSGQNHGGGQHTPDQTFNRIAGDAEVINLKQFQEFIDNEARSSRLKDKPELVERLFKRLDQNSDGVLTLEEYSEIQSLRRQ